MDERKRDEQIARNENEEKKWPEINMIVDTKL